MLTAEGSCSNSATSQSTLDRATAAVGKDHNDDCHSDPNDSLVEQQQPPNASPPESSHRSIRRSLHALGNKVSRHQQRTVSPPPPQSPNRAIYKRPSDDSIRSNFSSTSSVFSTASKISKFPHAVKSSLVSVKDYVAAKSHRRRTMIHSPTTPNNTAMINGRQSPQSSSNNEHHHHHHSFASRFRRRAPSVMGLSSMFSKENAQASCANSNVSPSVSSIHSPAAVDEERPPSSSKRRLAERRNSVLDVAARLLHATPRDNRPVSSAFGDVKVTPDDVKVDDDNGEEEEENGQLNNVIQQEKTATAYDEKAIGKLLFGVDIENLEFFDQDLSRSRASSIISDAKSDHVTASSSSKEVIWDQHKRAKSYQETGRIPSLRQLANGQYPVASSNNNNTVLDTHIPPIPTPPVNNMKPSSTNDNDGVPPFVSQKTAVAKHNNNNNNASYHTILVTATLTTLHSKLISDCDHLLETTMLPPSSTTTTTTNSESHRIFPENALLTIASDLRKMSDMVTWEASDDDNNPVSQKSVTQFFQALNDKISQGSSYAPSSTTATSKARKGENKQQHDIQLVVKEIISSMKQMVELCICQYHKVSEKALVIPCKGYKVEGKNKFGSTMDDYVVDQDTSPLLQEYLDGKLEHMDHDACWFRNHFVNKDYATFLGYRSDNEPIMFSALCDQNEKLFRLIVRDKQGPDVRKTINDALLLRAVPAKSLHVPDGTWKTIAETMLDLPFDRMKKIDAATMVSSGLEKELLMLDEQAVHRRYKCGVLYIKDGQTREEEWLANTDDSEAFDRFLGILGHKVELNGYTGWAGGLDTKSGDSGEYTYVNEWHGHEIAYHVSSLIPSRPGDRQQIQKKRHIGNDIVCVVFVKGQQPFNPAAIKSQFLHVFIVVHEDTWQGQIGWRVEVVTIDSVPSFGPPLPANAIFFDESQLQSFLLAKLINAEYAAYKSPKFMQPMARAREGILTRIVDRGYKIAKDPEISWFSGFNKTPSTSSDRSSKSTRSNSSDFIAPAPSRSSILRDLSENISAGIARRRSGHEPSESRTQTAKAVKLRKGKATRLSNVPSQQQQQQHQSRSRSEQDLMQSPMLTASRSSGAIIQNTASRAERQPISYRFFTSIGGASRRRYPSHQYDSSTATTTSKAKRA